MADIRIDGLRKTYGDFVATDDVSLHIRDGEFFTLLGPSGCGKSTLLSMIAGLVQPDGGSLVVGERTFSDAESKKIVLPENRDCGLVFQSYALWPHMTVEGNLEYGLKIKKVPNTERKRRIRETLELVELGHLAQRYPHELSGGQQQRAALARTIVTSPTVLLLDEPLSNLDAKLRMQARIWLKRIHQETGLTTVYVTHDQEEALSLSTRIAVMDSGRVQQVADPETLYRNPATRYVASFIGTTRFLRGETVAADADSVTVSLDVADTESRELRVATPQDARFVAGDIVTLALRPEQLQLVEEDDSSTAGSRLPCTVEAVSYLGSHYQYTVLVGDSALEVDSPTRIDSDRLVLIVRAGTVPVFREEALS